MARLSLFNSPLLLGFEPFEEALERITKASADGYPPYNVVQLAQDRLRITLAVAGFGPDDLEVQVQDNQLTIRGRQTDDKTAEYLHRGIAARQFQRSFVLADGIEVAGASMDNGLLHLDLERPINTPRVRKIDIVAESRTPAAGHNGVGGAGPRGVDGAGPRVRKADHPGRTESNE